MSVATFAKKHKTPLIIGGVILVGGLGYIGAKKFLKKQKVKKGVTGYSKHTVTTPQGTTLNLVETARQLGIDLGTAYASYDPRSWSENDNAALATIKSVPKNLIPQLMLEYLKLYNRNLQEDAQKYLDDYDEIRDKFL